MQPREVELSVVASGRNDNWNDSFDRVAPFTVAHNAAVLARHTASFELIFVEWAPLDDRPLLSQRLAALRPEVRCFVVPRAVHDGFRPGLPFLQYHARNVGIRRARGRRIAALNADILLTPTIVEAMLALPAGTCLRAPRHDVNVAVLEQGELDAVLAFCADPRYRVATHEIARQFGDRRMAWFENAAGDFACMHRRDWLRCGGFHERVDASMGVDAELIGQARRHGIALCACEHPVYHVDHPEQQPGRLHMPPFSETGYDNPDDWGLRDATFEPLTPQIACCPAQLAGTFTRVHWPPVVRWPEGFTGLAQLHDRRITRHHDAVVFCGVDDRVLGFSLYLELAPGQPRVWDDGRAITAQKCQELNWPAWPALRVQPNVLYVAMAGSPAASTLLAQGARHGRELLVIEPQTLVTFSPLRCALAACAPRRDMVVVYGLGHQGRMIARWLSTQPGIAPHVGVWDDDPTAREQVAADRARVVAPEHFRGARAGQIIIVSPRPQTGGLVMCDRLRAAGLSEWRDWIAWPFLIPRDDSGQGRNMHGCGCDDRTSCCPASASGRVADRW